MASVLVFDVETTGLNKERDQIIELGVQFGTAPGAGRRLWRFRPSVPIHPDAERTHGISAEMLADEPPFATHAVQIHALFSGADVLIGYNVGFDLEMLSAELKRAGQPIDLSRKTIVDLYRLWQQMEPRGLRDAHRRFCGGDFDGAHSADGDVLATTNVLHGMVRAFELAGMSFEQLAALCEPDRRSWIGPSNHLQWRCGVPVLTFGKHSGRALHDLAGSPDRSYLEWMVQKGNFPAHVKEVCTAALSSDGQSFLTSLLQTYPPPAVQDA